MIRRKAKTTEVDVGPDGSYAAIAGLTVEIDGYRLEPLAQDVSSGFRRVTTTVVLEGAGLEGRGEDVTYDAEAHAPFLAAPHHDLAGSWTFDDLSERLGTLDLFPVAPETDAWRDYRRWAFESAALDLALRQAGRTLGDALGRSYRPVRFVVSTRHDPFAWLAVAPGLEFKLDPTPDWDEQLMRRLAGTGRVRVLDLKGHYTGTVVDNPPDAGLYERCVTLFPDAVIEDPVLDDTTRPILRAAEHRLSWDAPIHSLDDVLALELPPRQLNVKPSRFGSVRRLLECVDWCGREGVAVYGGGQFELGVGRGQIQALASLLYPDAPNDVAPGGYNATEPQAGLPASPLAAPAPAAGIA